MGKLLPSPHTNSAVAARPRKPQAVRLPPGQKLGIYWEPDGAWYLGIVQKFDTKKAMHTILYGDSETRRSDLRNTKWKLVTSADGSSLLDKMPQAVSGGEEEEERIDWGMLKGTVREDELESGKTDLSGVRGARSAADAERRGPGCRKRNKIGSLKVRKRRVAAGAGGAGGAGGAVRGGGVEKRWRAALTRCMLH